MSQDTKLTRVEYLKLGGEEAHRRYYSQFVNRKVLSRLLQYIPAVKLKLSKDPHFNDIPLNEWDTIPLTPEAHALFYALGDYPTLAGKVCIFKQAARLYVNGDLVATE